MHKFLATLFGSAIAYFSLNTTVEMVALSSLIFLSYFFIQKKNHLFLFIFFYHLIASYGILFGIFNFYISGYILGFFSWILVATINTLPWILIWSKSLKKKMIFFPFIVLLTILPPLGFIDGTDPIVSAGLFFPGMGYWGILFYFLFLYILVFVGSIYMPGWRKWIFSIFLIILFILGNKISTFNQSNFIFPIQTHYSFLHSNENLNIHRQKELFLKIQKIKADTILLPEHIFGTFISQYMNIWKKLPSDKTVLAGAYIKEGKQYNNVLLSITKQGYTTLYIQRVPVPLSMWIPFSTNSVNATISSSHLVTFKGQKLGVLICYELYLPYLYLETMWQQPDYLVAISNLWWSKTKMISKIQKYYLILWSRLFAIPYFYSTNNSKKI